jgi:serine/threonine-protein phosphatase 4 regulatory subunit 1
MYRHRYFGSLSLPLNPDNNNRPHDVDDSFPRTDIDDDDTFLDDTHSDLPDLSPLEKIYLFSRSKAAFHRIYIIHALVSSLHDDHVPPSDAVEYILPLLRGFALDDGPSLLFSFTPRLNCPGEIHRRSSKGSSRL